MYKITIADFLFNIPLYSKIEICDFLLDDDPQYLLYKDVKLKNNPYNYISLFENFMIEYFNTEETFDGYNPYIKQDTTYEILKLSHFDSEGRYCSGIYSGIQYPFNIIMILVKCKRTNRIFYFTIFADFENCSIVKTGQYPSIADFHISKIKQYNSILQKNQQKEFTKAIGLAANGVGVGSFVYLRRVFECLIFDCFNKNKTNLEITEEEFKKLRMNEKIEKLSRYLPDFLVANKNIYSTLSKGIHELDEEECLKYFDILKGSIEIILDAILEEHNKAQKEKKYKRKASINARCS